MAIIFLGIAVLYFTLAVSASGLVILIYGSPILLGIVIGYKVFKQRLNLPEIKVHYGKSIWSLFFLGLGSMILSWLGHVVSAPIAIGLALLAVGLLVWALILPLSIVEK